LYSAWFAEDRETVVMPVGTSTDVMQTLETFKSGIAISAANATAIVDRDEWSEDHLQTLRDKGVYVLRVSEAEALLCLEGVFCAAAAHLGYKPDDKWAAFQVAGRKKYQEPALLHKQALARARREARRQLAAAADDVKTHMDYAAVRSAFVSALSPDNWSFDPASLLDAERELLEAAQDARSWDDFLALFPGKPIAEAAAATLGLASVDAYRTLVVSAVANAEKHPDTSARVVEALTPHLPSRTASA
jgi:hypothetical protein